MISLTDGVALPKEFDGLRRIRTSVVSTDVLAALYSDASVQWVREGRELRLVPDPSGEALIVLFDRSGRVQPLRRFRIQSAWVVFAVKPQGGWIVGREARHIGTGEVRDTTIYDGDGEIVRLLNAGSAIAFVQVSENSSFWIGHDDEEPARQAKMGGVTHFAEDGSEVFNIDLRGPDPGESKGMPFCCCYALNVIGNAAWTQHYKSMLVTRFESDGSAQSWMTEDNGAVALAIDDGIVARIGRYDENQYKISAFRLLEPPNSEFIGRLEFDIEGERPKYLGSVDGKGDTFHVVHDDKWYRLTLNEVLSALGQEA